MASHHGKETYSLISEEDEGPTSSTLIHPPVTLEEIQSQNEPERGCPLYFGVRSYLHQFYDPPSPTSESDLGFCDDCMQREIKRSSREIQILLCKLITLCGVTNAIFGVIILLISYLIPKKSIISGFKDNLEIIDRSAINFNDFLDNCRFTGQVILGLGFVFLIISLLVFICIPGRGIDDISNDVTVCRTMCRMQHNIMISPFDVDHEKIPVTEKITPVQPNKDCISLN